MGIGITEFEIKDLTIKLKNLPIEVESIGDELVTISHNITFPKLPPQFLEDDKFLIKKFF